jgi:predicted nucleic acid-binding protein
MTDTIVLDSFALISLFHKEPGWEKVQKIFYELSASGQKAILNIINWGEFYYIIKRRVGKRKAEETLVLLEQLPVAIIPVDARLVKEAAEIKSDYSVSYADAFCIATGQRYNGQVFTNDPEFELVRHLIDVIWLTDK